MKYLVKPWLHKNAKAKYILRIVFRSNWVLIVLVFYKVG